MTGPTAYRTVLTHTSANATGTRADLPATDAQAMANDKVRALVEAASGMRSIVEGIQGAMEHGTFRAEKGMRLKDTPEWVALYLALAALEKDHTE